MIIGGMRLILPFAAPLSEAGRQALADLRLPRLDAWLAEAALVTRDDADEATLSPPHERAAARALGWSQDRRAIAPLLDLLVVEDNNDVREYALTALEDLGERNVSIERPVELTE